jgi:hypothetical protein
MKVLIIVLLIILLVLAAILVAVRSNLCIIDNKKYIKKGGGMVSIDAINTYIQEQDLPPLSSEEKNSFASYLSLFFQDDADFLSIKHIAERDNAYNQWGISNFKMKNGDYNQSYLDMDLGNIDKALHTCVEELNILNLRSRSGPRIDAIKIDIINLFNAKRKKVLDDEKLAQELNDAEIARSLGEAEVAQSIGYGEVEHMPQNQQKLDNDMEFAIRQQELDNKVYGQIFDDAKFAQKLDQEINNEGTRQRPKSAYRPIRSEKNTPNRQERDYAMEKQLRNDAKLAQELSRQINDEEGRQSLQSAQRRLTSTYIPQRRPTSTQKSYNGATSTSSFLRNKSASEDESENIMQLMKKYKTNGYSERDAYNKAIKETNGDNSMTSNLSDSDPISLSDLHLSDYDPSSSRGSNLSNLRGSTPSSSSMRFTPVVQKLGNRDSENISSRGSNLSSSRGSTSNLRGITSNLRGITSNLSNSDSSNLSNSDPSNLMSFTSSSRDYTPSSSSRDYTPGLRGSTPSSSSMRFTPVVQKLGNRDSDNISSEEDIIKKIAELKQRVKNYEDSYDISPNDSTLDALSVCRDHIIRLESRLLKIERAKQYANSQKR